MAKKIGQILLELGLVTEGDIERALGMQRKDGGRRRLGEILQIEEESLIRALSIQLNIPIATEKQFPDALPVERVSFDFLRENLILPLSFYDDTMNVAVSASTKTDAIDSLRASFDCEIRIYLASGKEISEHLGRLQSSRGAVMQRLLEGVPEAEMAEELTVELSHLRDLAQEKGIVQLANVIIENAVKESASDIHIEPEETGVRVRYRIDGILYNREFLPPRTQAALSSRIKLLSQMNIAERRLPQDGRIRGKFIGKEIDIRVSTIPTVYGESIVMRLLFKETSFISLEELGFDGLLLEKYDALIRRPYGMILITGPTGSGKTTTLYASLDKINSPDKKIITIEEPVEYLMKGLNQIQVRPKVGLTFASGLRHIVRQDPDIVMVGEIRDLETAGIAIHAALTGHLLFSTLHTNDAPSAIARLLDMGAENYLVSSTLIGVVAQRLVRKICPRCREQYRVPDELRIQIGADVETLPRGKGCDYCMNTGYRGRVAIFELLVIDDGIRDLVMSRATSKQIKEMAVSFGMKTLREDGLEKARSGITTVEEVFRVTQAEI